MSLTKEILEKELKIKHDTVAVNNEKIAELDEQKEFLVGKNDQINTEINLINYFLKVISQPPDAEQAPESK